jgi:hypothetical protein
MWANWQCAATHAQSIQHTTEGLNMQPSPSLLTVKQFTEKHRAFTNGAIRNFIHRAKPRRHRGGEQLGNGFDAVIRRVGRRVYLNEAAFFEWVDKQRSPK